MRIRLVPFLLSISALSFVFFSLFALGINLVDREHAEAEKRAKANLERALDAEEKLFHEREEADSLRTILEARDDDRVLWLARAIYSETTDPTEMYYVAWVVRNRVEVGYNGKDTYYGVILDPMQFSAFNRGNPKREFYMNLDTDFVNHPVHKNWHDALEISRHVLNADSSNRPFSPSTLYFYSEVSMPDYKPHPTWASRFSRVSVPGVKDKRFRFFADTRYDGGTPPGINVASSSKNNNSTAK